MIRIACVFAVLFAATPCAAAEFAPMQLPPATCPQPNWYTLRFFPPPPADVLKSARPGIVTFAARSDAYLACLRRSRDLLHAKWTQAGRPADPVVDAVLANSLATWQSHRDEAVERFNGLVAMPGRAAGASDAPSVPPIGADEIAAVAVTAAPGSADITLPSVAVGRTHDCSSFYLDESKRANESGQVTFAYDIAADGAIVNPHVTTSSGYPRLDDAAMACVTTQWRNMPALQDGVAAASPGHQAMIAFNLW